MIALTSNTYTILTYLAASDTPLTAAQLLKLITPTTTANGDKPCKNWGHSYFTSGRGYNSSTSLLHRGLITQVGKLGNSRTFAINSKGRLALEQNS